MLYVTELTWGWSYNSTSGDPPEKVGLTGYGFFWILVAVSMILVLSLYMILGLIYSPLDLFYYIRSKCKQQDNNI